MTVLAKLKGRQKEKKRFTYLFPTCTSSFLLPCFTSLLSLLVGLFVLVPPPSVHVHCNVLLTRTNGNVSDLQNENDSTVFESLMVHGNKVSSGDSRTRLRRDAFEDYHLELKEYAENAKAPSGNPFLEVKEQEYEFYLHTLPDKAKKMTELSLEEFRLYDTVRVMTTGAKGALYQWLLEFKVCPGLQEGSDKDGVPEQVPELNEECKNLIISAWNNIEAQQKWTLPLSSQKRTKENQLIAIGDIYPILQVLLAVKELWDLVLGSGSNGCEIKKEHEVRQEVWGNNGLLALLCNDDLGSKKLKSLKYICTKKSSPDTDQRLFFWGIKAGCNIASQRLKSSGVKKFKFATTLGFGVYLSDNPFEHSLHYEGAALVCKAEKKHMKIIDTNDPTFKKKFLLDLSDEEKPKEKPLGTSYNFFDQPSLMESSATKVHNLMMLGKNYFDRLYVSKYNLDYQTKCHPVNFAHISNYFQKLLERVKVELPDFRPDYDPPKDLHQLRENVIASESLCIHLWHMVEGNKDKIEQFLQKIVLDKLLFLEKYKALLKKIRAEFKNVNFLKKCHDWFNFLSESGNIIGSKLKEESLIIADSFSTLKLPKEEKADLVVKLAGAFLYPDDPDLDPDGELFWGRIRPTLSCPGFQLHSGLSFQLSSIFSAKAILFHPVLLKWAPEFSKKYVFASAVGISFGVVIVSFIIQSRVLLTKCLDWLKLPTLDAITFRMVPVERNVCNRLCFPCVSEVGPFVYILTRGKSYP
eukprot:Nk52_evm85s2367 gene=Nk52_evmTU85s2367